MTFVQEPNCLVIDVHYFTQGAVAAGLLFQGWSSETEHSSYSVFIEQVAEYQPGKFYLRELPCLIALINKVVEPIDFIIIDGYVTLGDDNKPGLGMHLWHALNQQVPIIGVAKSSFHNTIKESQLIRGISKNPLFISAVGIDLSVAKSYILQMHGSNRLPTLIKKVDNLCRATDFKIP